MQESKMEHLRQVAEQIMQQKDLREKIQFSGDVEKLVEELNVYQIELQMQNQELQVANEQIESDKNRYKELFIEAPVAYFTLNRTGNIIELNNAAADLLQLPLHQFRYTSIFPYLEEESKIKFTKYFKSFFESDKIEYGEVTFFKANNEPVYTKLSSIRYFDKKLNDYLCRCAVTDITDLKILQSENDLLKQIGEQNKRLSESEILLNVTGELANIGGWKLDIATQELTWTNQVYVIHEVDDDFIPTVEKTINFYDEASKPKIQNALKQTIESGEPFDLELGIITAKGKPLKVKVIGKVKISDDGLPIFVYGSFQDITNQRMTEDALIASKQRLEEAQQIAHMGNWDLDIVNNKLSWSNEIYRIFDCEPQEFEATYEAFLKFVHPDDRDLVNEAYTNSLKTKEPYDIVHRLITKDGTEKYVREKCETIFDVEGKPLLSKGIVFDITDLKKKEEELQFLSQKYKQLFEFMPVGISLADENGNLTENNKAAEVLLGISREEHNRRSVDGQEWKVIRKDGSIMPPEEFASVRALKENRLIENIELGIDKGNGNVTWLNVSAVPKTYAKGVIISYIDITEKIEREKKIIRYSEELKESNATKDKFFSIIAHDLKNPFHNIMGFTDILIKNIGKYENEKVLKILETIHDTSKITYSLLENLLLWAKTHSNKITFNSVKNNLNDIIHENILIVQGQAKAKGITIETNLYPSSIVRCDKDMITTVIRNLLTNAIKFSNIDGNIKVSVERKNYEFIVKVSDNGVGISKENIEKLFKIESKFQTKGTNNEIGTGLGLILCKEFVELHYGKIWAESELGKGSTFMFTIPVCPEESFEVKKFL